LINEPEQSTFIKKKLQYLPEHPFQMASESTVKHSNESPFAPITDDSCTDFETAMIQLNL